ncbi:MAG: D-sedoheptulose 7-phosphate isomerase [Nitrospinae bacterium]|nr:D-sedoheptulose 7-phosphate isomerase [Nitrospinota bacterium]
MSYELIKSALIESANIKRTISEELCHEIECGIKMISNALKRGKKILLMGNGGSAADAQHLAGELIGRFKAERKAIPAIALTTDTSIITAVGNDYGFDTIFERQIDALTCKGDVVIGISTSGRSPNIIKGLRLAKELGAKTIALLGNDGGGVKEMVDLAIVIPSYNTPRIQEAHITIGHIICEEVEKEFLLYQKI